MTIIVNEIFYSIQGESLFAGLACVFVRLTGCNLRCTYCDTRYAYKEGIAMEIPQIISRVAGYGCSLVEITGGEPLLQQNTPRLIEKLIKSGYTVLMETNGTFDISRVDDRCIKIVDMKCPTSSEIEKNDLNNLKRLNNNDQVKFVIGNREDYDYAKYIKNLIRSDFPGRHILFSPVHEIMKADKLSQWILSDKLNVRLHLQLHKLIWPKVDRSV